MDCFVVSLLAMTKKQETVSLTSSLRLWNCHCETLQKEWESRYRDNHTQPTPSLREPKVRGNLGMGYNIIHSILLFCLFADNNFFFFSVFVFIISGLWIASSFYSSQWQHPNIVIARLWKSRGNLVYSRLVIARTEGSWQSQHGEILRHLIIITKVSIYTSYPYTITIVQLFKRLIII